MGGDPGRGVMKRMLTPGRSAVRYHAEDYDDNGYLKAPLRMWLGVLWMLMPWWMMAVGIASGDTLSVAEELYPTTVDMVLGLVLSLPAFLVFAVYPLRGHVPRWSLITYGLFFGGMALELMRLGSVMLRLTDHEMEASGDLLFSVMCVDFAVMLGMLMTPRLWSVFGGPEVR
ncbi:DUF2919 family protein [Salmonella enterica subsp. enterica]|nr:DUF2919 family protein [Salmonella enterica subsp. enterica serovar Hvittingfoss]